MFLIDMPSKFILRIDALLSSLHAKMIDIASWISNLIIRPGACLRSGAV